jgi:DNA/RNA endonuclease YhcR with UshA esterase domain
MSSLRSASIKSVNAAAGVALGALLWLPLPMVATAQQGQAPQGQQQQQAQQQQQKPKIAWATIAQTEVLPVDSHVFVRAKLLSVAAPDEGSRQPYSLYIQDNTGTRRVVIWQNIWNAMPDPRIFQSGMIIDVYAKVGEFRGQRQLEVNDHRWIRLAPGVRQSLPNSAFREGASESAGERVVQTSIGAVNMTAIGKKVRIRGTVTEFTPSPAPRVPERMVLKDHTGEIEVVYWSDVIEKLPASRKAVIGQPYEATGVIGEWRGKLQLKVTEVEDIGPPAPAVPAVADGGFDFPEGG